MNGAIIGDNCLVGSNTLITEGKEIPAGSLVLGSPGKVVRQISDTEVEEITGASERYVNNARRYREGLRTQTTLEMI